MVPTAPLILMSIKTHTCLVSMKDHLIKAVFSEENCVPATAIGDAKHAYYSLLCHNVPSIISRESIHKHNLGQNLKLQSAVVL